MLPVIERNQFPKLFSHLNFKKGVEIGTLHGDFAIHIVDNWQGQLFCVDRWKHVEGLRDINNKSNVEMEQIFLNAKKRLEERGITIIRSWSVKAARKFKKGELDWVYIDADHRKESVLADLNSWWDKVRKGGIISGHDYLDAIDNQSAEFGVKSAVDEFLAQKGLFAWETFESDFKSWYVVK